LAQSSFQDFSALSENLSAGKKVFFVVTKILELLAIPPLVLLGIAWAPISLLLVVPLPFCQKGESRFTPLGEAITNCANWPLGAANMIWEWTLMGSVNIAKPTVGVIYGLVTTTLTTLAAAAAVVLFFTTPFIPLIVLVPVVAVCGCAIIFGLCVFLSSLLFYPKEMGFSDMAPGDQNRILEKIRIVNPNFHSRKTRDVKEILRSWSQFGECTPPYVWQNILNALKTLHKNWVDYVTDNIPLLIEKLITYCDNGTGLVQLLKMYEIRVNRKTVEKNLYNDAYPIYARIVERAKRDQDFAEEFQRVFEYNLLDFCVRT
jgi:hypothetical protein